MNRIVQANATRHTATVVGGFHRLRAGWAAGLLVVLFGCGSTSGTQPRTADAEAPEGTEQAEASWPSLWTRRTEATPMAALPAEIAELAGACQSVDAGLMRVAERLAERLAGGEPPLQSDELMFELRAAGVPQTWPTVWALSGLPDERAGGAGVQSEVRARLPQWLASQPTLGQRLCGIAQRSAAGGELHVVAVTIDAVANLDPIERQVRQSQWVDVQARMLVPTEAGQVVVLGPRGAPFRVPTSLNADTLRARVNLDAPGMWLIQVLATVEGGPRPVLEATVFVDELPPPVFHSAPAPGEKSAGEASPMALPDGLTTMLNAARATEGLPALARNPQLDQLALHHAQAMLARQRVAHDVGEGDPVRRLQAAGIDAAMVGENVAVGANLVGAHRALWASPSHRGNMLHSRFSDVGIGIVQDAAGKVWVCELFASF